MEDAREYLSEIPAFAREKHSLSQAESFFRELGCPFPGRVIHVAGTNGKGSVCAFLSSILRASGFHVGTFTSPHLTDIRERICLDGELIGEKAFQQSFEKVYQVWKKMEKEGMTHPTFFEYLFYMAAAWFYQVKPDVVILETGMGGRRDVTNICRPDIAVITSISQDHMAYLGNTVEEIAGEKAGIIKKGVPLVFDGNDSRASGVIREAAEAAKAPWWDVREENLSVAWEGIFPRVAYPFADGRAEAVLPFPAGYQVWNGALAVKAAEILKELQDKEASPAGKAPGPEITAEAVAEGLSSARHGGRMEEVLPGFYLDGAHNRDGIRAFGQAAARIGRERGRKIHLLFSAVSDKEYGTMAAELAEDLKPEDITVARMESERGLSLEAMEKAFSGAGCPVYGYGSVREALRAALKRKGEDLLFAAGSLYFVGELKECLKEEEHDKF